MKKRKLISLFLSVVIVLSAFSVSAGAASGSVGEETVTPYWVNTRAVTLTLTFSDGYAHLYVTVTGLSGTTFSDGTVTLTKLDSPGKGTVKVWEGLSSSTAVFRFSNTSTPVTYEGTYELSISIFATRNGVSEEVYSYRETTYNP